MIPQKEQEFGTIDAVELKRKAQRGAMQPVLCCGNDGAHYFLKPFSGGSAWPLALEWICARLGRQLLLPIPNCRQIRVSENLAEEWNALNERKISAGVGFGSFGMDNQSRWTSVVRPPIATKPEQRLPQRMDKS